MIIHKATYIISSPDTASCPKPDRPEYAFIGRSNVGKSSLINMITGTKNLAKTSSTPGKTQLINHFAIDSKAKDRMEANSSPLGCTCWVGEKLWFDTSVRNHC